MIVNCDTSAPVPLVIFGATRKRLVESPVAREAVGERLDDVGITTEVLRLAGSVAEVHVLRAYDAVHLASALLVDDAEMIFATGDRRLAAAAREAGLVVNELGAP